MMKLSESNIISCVCITKQPATEPRYGENYQICGGGENYSGMSIAEARLKLVAEGFQEDEHPWNGELSVHFIKENPQEIHRVMLSV